MNIKSLEEAVKRKEKELKEAQKNLATVMAKKDLIRELFENMIAEVPGNKQGIVSVSIKSETEVHVKFEKGMRLRAMDARARAQKVSGIRFGIMEGHCGAYNTNWWTLGLSISYINKLGK